MYITRILTYPPVFGLIDLCDAILEESQFFFIINDDKVWIRLGHTVLSAPVPHVAIAVAIAEPVAMIIWTLLVSTGTWYYKNIEKKVMKIKAQQRYSSTGVDRFTNLFQL